MSHKEIQELLSDFRDGELPDAARGAVASHLKACAECRAELAFYARAAAVLLPAAAEPAPAETEAFALSVRSRLEEAEAAGAAPFLDRLISARWAAPALAFGLAAACAAAIALPPRHHAEDPSAGFMQAQDLRAYALLFDQTSAADALAPLVAAR